MDRSKYTHQAGMAVRSDTRSFQHHRRSGSPAGACGLLVLLSLPQNLALTKPPNSDHKSTCPNFSRRRTQVQVHRPRTRSRRCRLRSRIHHGMLLGPRCRDRRVGWYAGRFGGCRCCGSSAEGEEGESLVGAGRGLTQIQRILRWSDATASSRIRTSITFQRGTGRNRMKSICLVGLFTGMVGNAFSLARVHMVPNG